MNMCVCAVGDERGRSAYKRGYRSTAVKRAHRQGRRGHRVGSSTRPDGDYVAKSCSARPKCFHDYEYTFTRAVLT